MRDGKTILVADKSGKISFLEFSGKLQERIDKVLHIYIYIRIIVYNI